MDNIYWENFYKNQNHILESSDFAKFVLTYIKKFDRKFNILEVGSGNGRDSYYLSQEHVLCGCDMSFKPDNKENCTFIIDDMVSIDKNEYDLIYSRFSFHSITDDDQDKLLKTIKKSTILCIETRSIKGLNESRVFGDNHFRNLTNINKLKELLKKYNFEILYIEESNNFAIYKDENPICIRVICQKMVN